MKTEIEEKQQPRRSYTWLYFLPVLAIILGLLIFFGFQIYGNWTELLFTMKKPNIVRSIRLDYEKRQTMLEESFLKREKTAEEKLIETITEELKK